MIGAYFIQSGMLLGSEADMMDWFNIYCETKNGRAWRWIIHEEQRNHWGIMLPDTETLVMFKLKFGVGTFDEFDTGEPAEDFAIRNFSLTIG